MHHLSVRRVMDSENIGAEGIFVKRHRFRSVIHDQMRGDGMGAVGNAFHFSCHMHPLFKKMPGRGSPGAY